MANLRSDAPLPVRRFLAGLLLAACAAGDAGPVLLHPLPPPGDPYRLSQGELVYEGSGFRVSARPTDWRLAEKEYGDGFGDLSGFLFIALRIENSSAETIHFQPVRTALHSRSGKPARALDVADVHLRWGQEPDAAERAGRFRKLSFEGSASVSRGETDERYLVFPVPEGRLRTLELRLKGLYVGSREVELGFTFEAFPVEEEPASP